MHQEEVRALARALRQIETIHYLSHKGLALRLGYSTSYLSMLVRGKRRPSPRFLRAFLQEFPEAKLLLAANLKAARRGVRAPASTAKDRPPPSRKGHEGGE